MTTPYLTVAVLGLGTVGADLTARLARAGLDVVAVEADPRALPGGRARVQRGLEPDAAARVRYTADAADIKVADLVIEAVPERLADKARVLRKAAAVCAPDTVFATTTTALSVAEVAEAGGRPERTVALHPAEPGRSPGAVELAGAPATGPEVLAGVAELVRRLGAEPVPVPDRPGFVTGALLLGYLNAAAAMVEQGYAGRDEIDGAMRVGCGLPCGPLAHLDMIGLDVALDALTLLHERTGEARYAPAPVLARMAAEGRLGRKTGRGFHAWGPDGEPESSAAPPPPPDLPPGTRARPVERVAVVGSGTMATGIAQVCVTAGLPTVLVARTGEKAQAAHDAVRRALERAAARGRLSEPDLAAAVARLAAGAQIDLVAGCDLVVEAVVEDAAVKREVFAALDAAASPGAVLATSTSSLSVTDLAEATARPGDVIGMHFFNPPSAIRLVEIGRGPRTAAQTVATVHELAGRLGRFPVHCGDRAGFIVNALLLPYLNAAVAVHAAGDLPAERIDQAVSAGLGYPLGPLALLDTIGLDVSQAILRNLHQAFHDPAMAPAADLDALVRAGRLGRKTGQGFHAYPARPSGPAASVPGRTH